MSVLEEMFDESGALDKVELGTSKSLSVLIGEMRRLEDDIQAAEEHVKELKRELKSYSHEKIPALMDEMGVESFTTDEGVSVGIKNVVHASITQENKEQAFAWLRKEGLDDIIKNDVVVTFGKGEDNVAGDVVGILQEKGFDPKTKTHVHPSTLKAFVKERIVDGKPIDLDMFGAFIANAAEIRRKA